MRAAEVTTTPSRSTGVRRTAACARKPAIAARSGEEMALRTAMGSCLMARTRYMASRTAVTLRFQPSSSMPVPRPTTTTGSVLVMAPMRAAAGVVLPIPRSPAMRRSTPESTSWSATRCPICSERITWSSSMASSRSMEPQLRETRSSPHTSWSRETSTTRTEAPAARPSTLMAAPPA